MATAVLKKETEGGLFVFPSNQNQIELDWIQYNTTLYKPSKPALRAVVSFALLTESNGGISLTHKLSNTLSLSPTTMLQRPRRRCEGTAMGAIVLDLRPGLGIGPFSLGNYYNYPYSIPFFS